MARHRRIRTYLDTRLRQTPDLDTRTKRPRPRVLRPGQSARQARLAHFPTAIHQWIYLPNSGTLIVRNAIAEYIVSLGNLLFRLP